MKTIVVSDIFGLTAHLKELAQSISRDCEILDPYNGQILEFKTEQEAYNHFSAVCGLDKYSGLVRKKIKDRAQPIFIIGFSVGATAVWNTLEDSEASRIKKAVCFYGSRIREKPTVKPKCNTVLVFPKEEMHFSVPELSRLPAETPNVQCINTDFHHGFMNRLSVNFDSAGYAKYRDWLNQHFKNMERIKETTEFTKNTEFIELAYIDSPLMKQLKRCPLGPV